MCGLDACSFPTCASPETLCSYLAAGMQMQCYSDILASDYYICVCDFFYLKKKIDSRHPFEGCRAGHGEALARARI